MHVLRSWHVRFFILTYICLTSPGKEHVQGASASTTQTTSTMAQIKNLIDRMMKNKLATRAAGTSEEFRVDLCRKSTTWNYHIRCFDDNLGTQH